MRASLSFKGFQRYGHTYHFAGIYKIVSYTFCKRGGTVPRYYHSYYIPEGGRNWGDYVPGPIPQDGAQLTLEQAKDRCRVHAAANIPSPKLLTQANRVMLSWLNMDSSNDYNEE